ncbi:MAG: energy transducer TonB, partial [Myxococcota bacterium]|nr:energy transducer TonB [Myxococcota bacterium]
MTLVIRPAVAQTPSDSRTAGSETAPETPDETREGESSPADGKETAPEGPVVVPPRPLEVPQAVYPPEALAAGLEADVVLVLDISAEGVVTAADPKVVVGHGFDEAAVAAILRMRFEPATVDGVPRPVRVNYTYRFTIEKKVVEPVPEPEPEPEPEPLPVSIIGEALERGTRNKMAGVPVIVRDTGETVLTDGQGRFEMRLPPGLVVLEVPVDTHKPFRKAVKVRAGKV